MVPHPHIYLCSASLSCWVQRSYVAVLKEKKKQEAELEALQAALRETTAAVLKYDKSFVCSIKGTGTEM